MKLFLSIYRSSTLHTVHTSEDRLSFRIVSEQDQAFIYKDEEKCLPTYLYRFTQNIIISLRTQRFLRVLIVTPAVNPSMIVNYDLSYFFL